MRSACLHLFTARLPPALCRWSHNWRATSLPSTITRAATGPVPVEPQLACYQPPIHHHPGCHRPCAGGAQLACYQPPIHHHPGCHRPCAGGATTGVLPASYLPYPGCHRPCAGGATTGVLPASYPPYPGCHRPVPVSITDVLPSSHPPSPGCHRPCAGGATTGVLPSSHLPSPRLPPALCRWSHNWRATRRQRQSPTVASIRIQRTVRNRDRHSAVSCGLMWPRNAAGLMVSLTLGHFQSGSIPPWTALAAAPLRLSRAGIGGPFRAKKQAAIPVRCEAATGPVPVEPQLTCYHPPIHHHPGCHRPCAGGATTDVLPSSHPPSPRLPPALCRWSHN